ncbi:MAG: TetR/AcrR family transcriptional regulator [bacterium]|nr:TetR/AcrR family transcriptional regulator [bacterium]
MAVKNAPKPKSENAGGTRARIVETAATLIYRNGYTATSLDAVAQAAEVNRGSLYYFFKSKKNLALAVIDYFETLLHTHYLDPSLNGPGNGREKIERLAALYSRMPSFESPCCGCPIGNLSLELSGMDEDFQKRFARLWKGIFGRIAETLEQAQGEGMLPTDADTEGLARAFFSQIQGGHLVARATLDADSLQKDCRLAVENLPWLKTSATAANDKS